MASQLTAPLAAICKERDIGVTRASLVFGFELRRWDTNDVERILLQIDLLKRKLGSSDPYGPKANRYESLPLKRRFLFLGIRISGILLLLPLQICSAVYVGIWCWRWRAIMYEIPKPTMSVARLFSNVDSSVKAPRSLIEESIADKKALCVNRLGKFKLIGPQCKQKYAVLSYVWGNLMAWQKPEHWGAVELSIRRRGLPLEHLERLFDLCCESVVQGNVKSKEKMFVHRTYDYEWMWLDVIAMPEVLEDMDMRQQQEIETLRVGVINNLASIYQHADRTTVADGVVLRLRSGSMIDCAVTLCFGRWMTRLWTLVESYLAQKVIVRTADYAFDLDEIISFITKTVTNDHHRYWNVLLRLFYLRPTPKNSERRVFASPEDHQREREGAKIHILTDIPYATASRHTNVRVDHARILFPLTGLLWQAGWSVDDGFKHLYDSYPAHHESIDIYYRYREGHINRRGCVRGKAWENNVVIADLAEGY